MKRIIQVIQPDTAPLHLTWIINNICTNACSYCPENLHNGSNHNYDWENARKFFKLLFEKYHTNPFVIDKVLSGYIFLVLKTRN